MIQTKITAPLAKSSAKDTVKATATNTSSVQTTKTAEKKETKATAKPAEKKETKPAAKKATKPAAKKTAAKTAKTKAAKETLDVKADVFVQVGGMEYSESSIMEKVVAAWEAEGKKVSAIKRTKLYIKPEDGKAYYVINEGLKNGSTGAFEL